MRNNLTPFLQLLLLLTLETLHSQSQFPATYFTANHPKPTGEMDQQCLKTPDMLYLRAEAVYSVPSIRECVYAINKEGQKVWDSFNWSFLPDSELRYKSMIRASDGFLYIIVSEAENTLESYYFIKVNGQTGELVQKYKFTNGITPYSIFERIAGEIGVFYYNENFKHRLYLFSSQNLVVLQDHFLANHRVSGVLTDPSGDFIYGAADSLHKVNGLNPTQAYWRSKLPNSGSNYSASYFEVTPDGQSMIYWGEGNDSEIRAKVDLATGAVTTLATQHYGNGIYSIVDKIVRGDTVWHCYYGQSVYSSKFAIKAFSRTTGSIYYETSYQALNPSTGEPYYMHSGSSSFDMDQSGNLFIAGYSNSITHLGGMFIIIKVRASNGQKLITKVIDVTPGQVDVLSYARVAWCPDNQRLWIGGIIELSPNLKKPILCELNRTNCGLLQQRDLSGNYDYASAVTQFLPTSDGFCALLQLDNCISVVRYNNDHQLLWQKELCQLQLIKAGGLYPGTNNRIFVTGTNFYTGFPLGLQKPFYTDSLHLFQLDLATGQLQRQWKVPAPQDGYPLHVAAQSDTIRFFTHNNEYRRSYVIRNNVIHSYSGTYQSGVTDPMPVVPLKHKYVQRGRETIGATTDTKYVIWYPNSENTYNYPTTTAGTKVKCIAAINSNRDVIAGGVTSNFGWGIFRFKAGTSTLLWQKAGNTGSIDRILNVNDQVLYALGIRQNTTSIKKFSAVDGSLLWERDIDLYPYENRATVYDMTFDTLSGSLLLGGSILEPTGNRLAWVVKMDTSGVVQGQLIQDGDSPGASNQVFSTFRMPNGEFLIGGQLIRNGLDTAAFISGIPSQFFSVSGKVYCDFNNNNVRDVSEPAWAQTVSVNPNNYLGFPSPNGNYFLNVLQPGTYFAGVISPSPHYTVKKAFFSLNSTFTTITGADIRLVPVELNTPILDDAINLEEINPARYGFPTTLLVGVHSLGTIGSDSTMLTLNCGPQMDWQSMTPLDNSSSIQPFQLSNGALTTLLPSIDILDERSYLLQGQLNTLLVPGDTLVCIATTSPFPNTDVVMENNRDTLLLVVVGSHDPNDVTAYPSESVLNTSLAPDGSLDLTYRIRFENTGNYNTDFLRIENEYGPLIRPETFRLGASSAPCTIRFLENNRLEFSFPNYFLAPQSIDSLSSQGFVFYQMRTIPGLVVGDTIRNTADIYFDFNPPVHTNTAKTWITNDETVDAPVPSDDANLNFLLYPNPASIDTQVHFSTNLPLTEKWYLFDQSGRFVRSGIIAEGINAPGPGLFQVYCYGQVLSLVFFNP
jgi:hypothetical protein